MQISRSTWVLFISLVISYSSILTSITIWKNSYVGYLLCVFVSFLFGLLVKKFEDLVVIAVSSYVLAAAVAVIMVILPALLTGGERIHVETGILGSSGSIIYNSVIIIPLSFLCSIIGLFVFDTYVRRRRTLPEFATR